MEVSTSERRAPRRLISLLAAFGLVGALLVASAPNAVANGYTVTNKHDSGSGSLRKAITDAENHPGADTITFSGAVTGTITLVSTLPTITDTDGLTIQGPGAGQLTISGNDTVRILVVDPDAPLTVRDITIAHARNLGFPGPVHGGAVDNEGILTIANAVFSNNLAACGFGGAIYSLGSVTVTNSTFSGNQACDGGAIYANSGTIQLTDSTLTGNSTSGVGGSGGGIGVSGEATATITNSTIEGNSATGNGGGIYNETSVNVTSSTISDNTAAAGSHAGGGIYDDTDGGGIALTNTIVANNPTGTDCGDFYPVDGGYNISSDDSCGFNDSSSLQNTDPGLGPLADNGGTTQTMALGGESPAVDIIPPATNDCGTAINTDQRHVPRPQNLGCDSGAYEYVSESPSNIHGTVCNDANGNGGCDTGGSRPPQVPGSAVVPTTAEVGVPGVAMCLDENGNGQCDDVDVTTVTGPTGTYQFDGLAPGNYHLLMIVPDGWHTTNGNSSFGVGIPSGDQSVQLNFFIKQNAASLALSKSGPDSVQELNPITYTIDVYDNGTADANNVTVTDTIPDGTTFLSASATQGSCSHTTTTVTIVTCHLGTLFANTEGPPPVTIVVKAPEVSVDTPITNEASASASNAGTVTSDPVTTNVLANTGGSIPDATVPPGLKAPITFTTSTVATAAGAAAADENDKTVLSLKVPKKGPGGTVKLEELSCTALPCTGPRPGPFTIGPVFGGIVFNVVPPTGYTGRAPFQATLLWDASLNPVAGPVYYFKDGVTPTEIVMKKCGKKPVSPCLVVNKKLVTTDPLTNGDWMVVVAINSDPKMRK